MRSLVLALGFALVALAAAKHKFRKQADAEFLEKQRQVLSIYVGLGSDEDNIYNHEHKEFTFDKSEFYTKESVLEGFLKVYKRGFLYRDGVFTLHCHKTRHDTFKLFDLFYYAKDFDTFIKIAEWAKHEFHPMQFSMAFTTAVFHREDCKGITIPPLYEIHPNYFVFTEIMHQAYEANIHGVKYRKFELNDTAWEWSWHRDMTSGPYRTGPQWKGDDYESKLAYFREDVGLATWYAEFFLLFAPWVGGEKYPEFHFERRGEVFYTVHKWFLNRYNLERYANKLSPAEPFDYDVPVRHGYNPRLSDSFGRSFLARPDNMVPLQANNYEFWELEQYERRYYDAIDLKNMYNTKNYSFVALDEEHGLDVLASGIFGLRDAVNRPFFKPLLYSLFGAASNMVRASNDREFTMGVLGKVMTAPRDPAFYMVLTSMDEIFNTFLHTLPPYTYEQLDFPGVQLENFEIDKLVTFFERHDFEVTNGVPVPDATKRADKRYVVSDFRLNHKPFTYKVFIKSDKAVDATVRFFVGPKYDMEYRPLKINQARNAFTYLDFFRVKLTPGDNVIERSSHENMWFREHTPFRTLYEKVNNSIETKEAFYYNEINCGIPHNVMLPRGSTSGRKYQFYMIVTPYDYKQTEGSGICGHFHSFDQYSLNFPFDRHAVESHFTTPNMHFKDFNIYFKSEHDLNRPNQS